MTTINEQDVDFQRVGVSAGELHTRMSSMGLVDFGLIPIAEEKGIVNDQFSQIQTLKSDEHPDYAVWLINTYLLDVEAILSELTTISELPDADFSKLSTLARKIEEKSSLIGAEHVRCACADLIQACDWMHKQNFQRALGWIKSEFAHTQKKLDSFVQMERRIFRVEEREVK